MRFVCYGGCGRESEDLSWPRLPVGWFMVRGISLIKYACSTDCIESAKRNMIEDNIRQAQQVFVERVPLYNVSPYGGATMLPVDFSRFRFGYEAS